MKIYCQNQFCDKAVVLSDEKNEFGVYGMCGTCGVVVTSKKEIVEYKKGILEVVQEQNDRTDYLFKTKKKRDAALAPKRKPMHLKLVKRADRKPEDFIIKPKEQPKKPVKKVSVKKVVEKKLAKVSKLPKVDGRKNKPLFVKTKKLDAALEKPREKRSFFGRLIKGLIP